MDNIKKTVIVESDGRAPVPVIAHWVRPPLTLINKRRDGAPMSLIDAMSIIVQTQDSRTCTEYTSAQEVDQKARLSVKCRDDILVAKHVIFALEIMHNDLQNDLGHHDVPNTIHEHWRNTLIFLYTWTHFFGRDDTYHSNGWVKRRSGIWWESRSINVGQMGLNRWISTLMWVLLLTQRVTYTARGSIVFNTS
jgi:hypothetical protein